MLVRRKIEGIHPVSVTDTTNCPRAQTKGTNGGSDAAALVSLNLDSRLTRSALQSQAKITSASDALKTTESAARHFIQVLYFRRSNAFFDGTCLHERTKARKVAAESLAERF